MALPIHSYNGMGFVCTCVMKYDDPAVCMPQYLSNLLSEDAAVPGESQFKIYNQLIYQLATKAVGFPIRFGYEHVIRILDTVKDIFKSESPLVECGLDIRVIGDLHGSLYDLRRMLNQFNKLEINRDSTCSNGWVTVPGHLTTSFIFLGNYVDRGDESLELLMLLFCMKISARYSGRKVIMLRGNHETRVINYGGGFRAELQAKFDKWMADDLFEKFNDVFNYMPFACLVGKRHLCVHGGISPKLTSLDAIRNIPKPLECVDKHKLACDLIWADFREDVCGFVSNEERDISVVFGGDVLEDVLDSLRVEYLLRGHKKVKEGLEMSERGCATITSFSGRDKRNAVGMIHIDVHGRVQRYVLGSEHSLAACLPYFEEEEVAKKEEQCGDFIIEMARNE